MKTDPEGTDPSIDAGGWRESAQAWIDFVDEGDPNREGLLDPIMLGLVGDVKGRDVLDIGCGEGRFARMLAARGATVTGVDPIPEIIVEAIQRGRGPTYVKDNAEKLSFSDRSFDVVVSYVSLVDIPDYRAAIAEMVRVLRPGGRLVVSNCHSITTATSGWKRDEKGNKLHFPVDRYHDERGNVVRWSGIVITNFHRPLTSYMQAFLAGGLRLMHFVEPRPSPEAIRAHPRLADGDRVPYFWVMLWEKD